MADCSSDDSSETAGSDSSDFEVHVAAEGEIVGSNVEPFQGIQPWRFEPPARNSNQENLKQAQARQTRIHAAQPP